MEQNTLAKQSSSVSGDDATAVAAAVVTSDNSVDEAAAPYDKGTSVLLDDAVEDSGRGDANTPTTAAVGPDSQTTSAGGSGGSGGGAGAVTGTGGDTTAGGVSAPRRGSSDPFFGGPVDYKTTDLAASSVHEGYVQPSSYLLRRPRAASRTMPAAREETPVERDQKLALRSIRAFLKVRTSYDVLPLSYRLIVFDTGLLVKKSLNILVQNGIVSAPLWDSKTSTFAGMLTTSDYINLIQYYWQNPNDVSKIDQFRLDSLRDIEKAIGVAPIETISVHPLRPLYEACRRLIEARARRIPIIDIDDDTKRAMVVSVLTQYRLLKFVAINVSDTQLLRVPLKYLPNVGTYNRVQTADMDTPVIKVIHMLVSKQISSVPILNSDGVVVNVFEAVDVITLIKGGNYDCLTLPVGEALCQRALDFPGIFTCSLDDRLDSIFDTIRKSRVHRFVVIDDANRLKGILTLSDILKYILLEGENEDQA